ncbi:Hypothetical protein A7982_02503 [Minicystis rosea]|nr:Hypothetical protein A7982_02503 [Minicystis rosea]
MGRQRISALGMGAAGALAAALFARPVSAQALNSNRYSVDVFQGPVLAPSDVIGIAGAYAGYAEGIAGMVANAAAPAVREAESVSWVSWDVSPSISIPFNIFGKRDDFDNSGATDHGYTDFIYGTLGALLQVGPVGFGVNAEIQRYAVAPVKAGVAPTDVILGKYHALVALRVLGDQLMIGGGVRMATLSLTPHDDRETNLTMIGAAPEIGVLFRPDWQSFRVGATVRLPVHGGELIGKTAKRSDGVKTAAGLVLPRDVVLPWEVELGVAVQVGPRPINPEWVDPHVQEASLRASFLMKQQERYGRYVSELAAIPDASAREARRREIDAEEAVRRKQEEADEKRLAKDLENDRRARAWNWPRAHLLLTAELLMTGAVADGVSLARFLGQRNQDAGDTSVIGTSGAKVSFSPRVGVETEPIPGRMHTRAGTYFEPSRLGSRVGRQHFTFGLDVRLFTTTFWGLVPPTTFKAQTYADFSPRYQSVSVGLGVWH